MKIVKGNLIFLAESGNFDVIVQGCNCYHTMGAGLARQIATQYPEAYDADKLTILGPNKLGKISSCEVKSDQGFYFRIVNAYTQIYPYPPINLDAIRYAFREIKRLFTGKRIAYPKIGAGLGKGDWKEIEPIIDEELQGEDHTLVIYEK